MEINDIKNLWDAEEPAETPEISLEKQAEIRMPLERIRKNMRMEFWATVICLLAIVAASPVLIKIMDNIRFITYFVAFLLSFFLVISFYFFKFFKLYKDLEKTEFSTKESLSDLMWKFKLNEQYYLSYYLACVPVLLFEFAIILDYLPSFRRFTGIEFIFVFLASVLFSLFFLYYFGKYWFRTYYGKYIYQIKKKVDFLNLN